MSVWVPRRLRARLGIRSGEVISSSALNRAVQEIGCTHLPVFVSGDIANDAIDHLLDEHLYLDQSDSR